jgi:hypothetical protein
VSVLTCPHCITTHISASASRTTVLFSRTLSSAPPPNPSTENSTEHPDTLLAASPSHPPGPVSCSRRWQAVAVISAPCSGQGVLCWIPERPLSRGRNMPREPVIVPATMGPTCSGGSERHGSAMVGSDARHTHQTEMYRDRERERQRGREPQTDRQTGTCVNKLCRYISHTSSATPSLTQPLITPLLVPLPPPPSPALTHQGNGVVGVRRQHRMRSGHHVADSEHAEQTVTQTPHLSDMMMTRPDTL